MRRFSALALSSLYAITLTACATAPKAETLTAGISPADISKPMAEGEIRKVDDPICVSFYKNAQGYVQAASKPNQGANFLTSLGLSVLAGVATGGIATSGINNTVGQIAVQQVASTAIYQGGGLAIQGLKKDKGPGATITKTADELRCPVTLT